MNPKDPRNRIRVMSGGLRVVRLNRQMKLDKEFNLVTRIHGEYGRRFKGKYVFVGAALNYFIHDAGVEMKEYGINSAIIPVGKLFNQKAEVWPGYSVGVQL